MIKFTLFCFGVAGLFVAFVLLAMSGYSGERWTVRNVTAYLLFCACVGVIWWHWWLL